MQNKEQRTKLSVYLCSLFFFLCSLSAQGAERIVSLNACTDELLLQMAHPDQIAGVTSFDHSPRSGEVLEQNPHIKKLSSDIESVMAAQPSIILAGPFSNPLLIQQLKKMKINIMSLAVPKSWDEFQSGIEQLSKVVTNPHKQEMLRSRVERLAELKEGSRWKGKRAVFWSAAGHLSGKNTFEDQFLTTLGMVNADLGEGYRFVSLEKLIALRPEVVVVTQNPAHKNSWSHETLFHPALEKALSGLQYLHIPEEAVSCASEYTLEIAEKLLTGADI